MHVLCASLVLLAAPAPAPKERLAVIDFDARAVDPAIAENVTALVAAAVRKQKLYEVTTKKDIEKMLKFEEARQLAGGTADNESIAQLAGSLGISKLMNGSIGKLGAQYVLTINVMDTQSARVIASDTVALKAKDDALIGACDQLVKSLFEQLKEKTSAPTSPSAPP